MKPRAFGEATLYTFENKNGMVMEVTDFGATLYSLLVSDKEGNLCDVVLGYDTPKEYMGESNTGFGATIGRNGNRIGKATFTLNGKTYQLEKNNNGNNLHSGLNYYHHRMWEVKEVTDSSITFSLHSPDGDQGFPGTFDVDVTYTLTDENELKIDYYGIPQEDTVVNMTNHTYFNLNGHASGDVLEQEVWMDADAFTATDEELIPTGEIVNVEGTPMDFRVFTPIGAHLKDAFEQLRQAKGYDHNYEIIGEPGKLRYAACARSGVSGINMRVETTMPGIQLYTANLLGERRGKQGAVYGKNHAFCLETQFYPDSPNRSLFPSSMLRTGEKYDHTTVFTFSTDGMQ